MSEKSEKSVIIPTIFDDCEAIQIVNGVPALVIQDKDGEDNFGLVGGSEFIRRTGISRRILKDLSVLLGMPIYWRHQRFKDDPEYGYVRNPTIFNSYQPFNNRIFASGIAFSTSGSSSGPMPFLISLDYGESEGNPDGLVNFIEFDM